MIIDGKGGHIIVDTDPAAFPGGPRKSTGAVVVEIEIAGKLARIELDTNQAEALETAVHAARLVVQARAVSL